MRCVICDYEYHTGSGILENYPKENKSQFMEDVCFQCEQEIVQATYFNEKYGVEVEGEDNEEVENLDEDFGLSEVTLPKRDLLIE